MKGKVYLIGAGPGDPELLTIKALRALRAADLVLHDELASKEIIALAPPGAEIRNVGKRCGQKRVPQESIHDQMIHAANSGLAVARLKAGDPLIYGRAGEEIEALCVAGIDFEVIPGVTAASAAAAAAKVPLTHRHLASKLVFLTGHHCAEKEQPDWSSLATDSTIIVYMPGAPYSYIAAELRRAGVDKQTPCLIMSQVSKPESQVRWTTVGQLPQTPPLPAPSVLLVGEVISISSSFR
ncbi:MAG: uroporphyrinogen-III C-methyltransferase [Acidobacteria bacterium]|nr:uroporphyrinogen-III C-methyltransferase [Acidobacteriota bacterium]